MDHAEWRERVILVDKNDREIGTEEKLAAHRDGALHRALSVFVLDDAGRLLLQRRSLGKYHSGGLWSNSCCGHPRPGESTEAAAHRRLREEMGFDCELRPILSFVYHAALGGELCEHELDHVFLGCFRGQPDSNAYEVSEWRWITVPNLTEELSREPWRFSVWLPIALGELLSRGLLADS